jgi:nucleoside-diphosphate-sugar epimerase
MNPDISSAEVLSRPPTPALKGWVCVTGAGGFIGSRLVARVLAENVSVRCLRRSDSTGAAPPGADVRYCDFSDTKSVTSAIEGVTIIFHLGGMASAASAHEHPDAAFRANTLATQSILEAARVRGVERVVLLSTAHVYGLPRRLPMTEEQPYAPASLYAATKLAADVMALAYHRSYGLPVNVLRPFNVYGPGQTAAAILPTIISQAIGGMPVKVRDLRPKRDFLFVDDVVDALIIAATASPTGQEFLLASGNPVSVATLLRLVTSLASGVAVNTPQEEPDGGDCVYGTSERARATLGWVPRVGLKEGLERTIQWWREEMPHATALDQR